MELKDKILGLRKSHGLTQDDMAEALHVSRQTVYKWETGKGQPDLDRLKQLCLLFDISADQLLDISISMDTPASAADAENLHAAVDCAKPHKPRLWGYALALVIAAALLLCIVSAFRLTRRSEEAQGIIELGITAFDSERHDDNTVTEKELLKLLSDICTAQTGEACQPLTAATAKATKERMTREQTAYWLYCAHIWTKIDSGAELDIACENPSISMRNVYEDLNMPARLYLDGLMPQWEKKLCSELSEIEALFEQYDGSQDMDQAINAILYGPYCSSVEFCLAQRSFENGKPLMETRAGEFRPKDKVTPDEALVAAYRLYSSW